MNNPAYWGRPYYQAVRFGESHDMVSAQDPQTLNQRIAARPPFGFGYQMGTRRWAVSSPLLSNGTPMLPSWARKSARRTPFPSPDPNEIINPQNCEFPAGGPTDQTRILAWFRQLMGLRNDASKGLRGDSNYQVVATGNRTIAYTCGVSQSLFTVITFWHSRRAGVVDSSWLRPARRLGLQGNLQFLMARLPGRIRTGTRQRRLRRRDHQRPTPPAPATAWWARWFWSGGRKAEGVIGSRKRSVLASNTFALVDRGAREVRDVGP